MAILGVPVVPSPLVLHVCLVLNHHSKSEKEQAQRQRKPKETEVAFAQGDDDGPRGFGHRKGSCRIYAKAGHHAWECPDKDKDKNDKDFSNLFEKQMHPNRNSRTLTNRFYRLVTRETAFNCLYP